jgi:TATA-binding protein-associated factor Taf7
MKLIPPPQVDQILTKMEFKSYQANTSKALTKAGFKRTGTTGRHVKWILPDLGVSEDDIFAVAARAGAVGRVNEEDEEEEDNEEDDENDDDEVEDVDNEKREGKDDDEEEDEERNEEMEETLETEGGIDD